MSKVKINIGDLVSVDGYEGRIFQVEGYAITENFYLGEQWTDIVFDLTDVRTGEYAVAFDEDIRRLAPASQAEEYLAENKPGDPYALAEGTWGGVFYYPYGDGYMPRNDSLAKPKPKVTKAERIDNLLDIRNWNAERYEKTSEMTYRVKIEEIDEELAKLAAEGRR